jgi:4'-phosphopantetheinyl transferase EntD
MITSEDRLGALLRLARDLAPAGAAVATFRPDGVATTYAEEARAVARAVPARRREFAAGRTAARSALAQLGIAPAPIPVGAGRAPVWPDGVTGSIAHCALGGIVVAARKDAVSSLGVDLEGDAPLTPDLWPGILTDDERCDLARLSEEARGHAALDRFVAKEALFKAQYPLTGLMLDFDAVTVNFPETGRFAALIRRPFGPFLPGRSVQGRIGRVAGAILAIVALRPEAIPPPGG